MCGICGILGRTGKQSKDEIIAGMNRALSHRGPDDEGTYSGESISLGHRRLSIIDLSMDGHQPMSTYEGRLVITFNGELYNYKELRQDLQRAALDTNASAYPFRTQSDTEIILASYLRWGVGCLKYFNGMYAFAIWDKLKKELFIARDRLGIKPLYYWLDDATFIFASEIRALLASNLIARKLSQHALTDYATYQTVHAPFTIIENVKMLLPGHFMVIKEGDLLRDIKPITYWSFADIVPQNHGINYKETCDKVRQLLYSAVEGHLVSDVPLGAFLSGGVDSSTVVAIMSKVMGKKVNTFSVTFNEAEYDESVYSNQVAKLYDTTHHEIKLSLNDLLDRLPEAMDVMDHSSGDGINSYVVARAAKNAGVAVALSGLGGDEIFAGYPLFKRLYELEKLKRLEGISSVFINTPLLIANLLRHNPASEKLLELQKQPDWRSVSNNYLSSREILQYAEVNSILRKVTGIDRNLAINPSLGILSRISVAELTNYLPDMLLCDIDQMSMAHALEVRVPFLDHHLVEYVTGLDDESKYPHTPKKLLTDATTGLLPDNILKRKKMGFELPWGRWIKKGLLPFCDSSIRSLAQRKSFNSQGVLNLWDGFQHHSTRVPWHKVWHLAILGRWLNKHGIEG
jgi:asparagine synthase (glutamine-hydrolysing)